MKVTRLLTLIGMLGLAAATPAATQAATASSATASRATSSRQTTTSDAQLWTALGGAVTCGIAIHPPNTPPIQLLCSAIAVPPPKAKGFGDPGFVFLSSVGHPSPARLSQDSFVGTGEPVKLGSASKWGGGPIAVSCTITARKVRCENRSHHGFTITKRSYRSF
jgi:hypothetical protein